MGTKKASLTTSLVLFLALGLCAPAWGFIRGDANGDGAVDVADVVSILGSLFVPGKPLPDCLDAADANDSGAVDIGDAVYLTGHLFLPDGAPPPAPFPGDGADPTPDGLGDCDVPALSLPFEELSAGTQSGAPEWLTIIRDKPTWAHFWDLHAGNSDTPFVDFDEEMVVILVRHAPSGGEKVNIDELLLRDEIIEVHYTRVVPRKGCPLTPQETQPFHIVRTRTTRGEAIPVESIVKVCP
ncbi:MAG: hypothetical protein ACE5GW_03940 [Planctomycetota bacterium]